MPDRIRFTALLRHFDEVKTTIDAIIQQIITQMEPVEREISDPKKIRFI